MSKNKTIGDEQAKTTKSRQKVEKSKLAQQPIVDVSRRGPTVAPFDFDGGGNGILSRQTSSVMSRQPSILSSEPRSILRRQLSVRGTETVDDLPRVRLGGRTFADFAVQPCSPPPIQPKLMVGPVGDKYEQEADRVAAQVVSASRDPNEAWHVIQQKQGRVKPTVQMKGKVTINDDAGLEREADVMGAKALQMRPRADTATGAGHETGSAMLQGSDGELVQRALAANSYVSSPTRGYLKVLDQIDNQTVVRVKTGNVNRIIRTTGSEYEHMRRAPVPLTTEPVVDAVYSLHDAPTRMISLYEIEPALNQEPELTWAMGVVSEQFELALDMVRFLNGLPDEPTRIRVKGLLETVGGDGLRITAITSFLNRFAEPAALIDATTILETVQGDVPKAEAAINFLANQKPAELALARRELEDAGFDAVDAAARMIELAPLLNTAATNATTRAEETHATAQQDAQTASEHAMQEYRQMHEKELPKPPSKSQAKKGKRQKLGPKQQAAVTALSQFEQEKKDEEQQAIKQADLQKPVNEASYLSEEVNFVSEITAGAQKRETVTQLAALVGQDKRKIRALHALMLEQPNVDEMTLAKRVVASGLDVVNLATTCKPLLNTLASTALVFVTGALIVESGSAAVMQWIQTAPATVNESIVADLRKKLVFVTPLLEAYQVLGYTSLFHDMVTYIETRNITKADKLTWLLGQRAALSAADFGLLLYHASTDKQSLAELKNIFTTNNDPGRLNHLSVKDLLSLVGTRKAQIVLDAYAIVQPTDPVQVVQMILRYSNAQDVGAAPALKILMRIKGELAYDAANAQTMITVLKSDTTYAHGGRFGDPGYGKDRTGFLRLTFRNGDTADVHTHWNVNAKSVVSMHVQTGGGNGVEINQWGDWFGDVRDLVKLRQNNAPGGMEASIAPLIRTLNSGNYPDRHDWTRANGALT